MPGSLTLTCSALRQCRFLADAATGLWANAASLREGEQQTLCHAGIARCEHAVAVDAKLASIARWILNIPTLATRKMDSLDFHEVSVWQVFAALRLAHRLARKDRRE